MGTWWKLLVAVAVVIISTMAAHARDDWRGCVDETDRAAARAACGRLIASGKAGAMLPKVYMMRAFHASSLNDYDAAISDFSELIRLAPTAKHYQHRGVAWMFKTNYPQAVEDFDRSLRIDPGNHDTRYYRALAIGRGGDSSRAISAFDEALRNNPLCAMCAVKKAFYQEKLGDVAGARGSYNQALALAGRSPGSDNDEARRTARAELARLDAASATPAPSTAPAVSPIAPVNTAVASAPAAPAPTAMAPYSSKVASAPGRRVALVIGNSSYRAVPALQNPGRDAATVADSLRSVGFQKVTLATDLARDRLIDALKSFAAEADGADWAMVYFAGHGIEVGGQNYILPIDAKLATDRDVQYEAVALEQIVSATEGAKKLHLVMLDACRDNPFANTMRRTVASRSLGHGLAQIEPDAGTLVVFSAKHGQVAFDGEGRNSPFVSAFVRRIATPGIEIRKLFDLVRDDVMAATNRQQQPYSYGSVPGSEDFYFLAGGR